MGWVAGCIARPAWAGDRLLGISGDETRKFGGPPITGPCGLSPNFAQTPHAFVGPTGTPAALF